MKSYNVVLLLAAVAALIVFVSGCNTAGSIAEGISEKSISGSGMVTYSRVGLNKTTQTPELFNLFVWGDYTSVVPGDEIFRLEEVEDASIFNSSAVTKHKKVFFASGDKARMDAVIAKLTAPSGDKSASGSGKTVSTQK